MTIVISTDLQGDTTACGLSVDYALAVVKNGCGSEYILRKST